MAPFKSYASPGGFKPIQAPDVARMVEEKARQQSNYLQQAAQYQINERNRIGNAIEINNRTEFQNRQQILDMENRNRQAIQNQILGNYNATIANAQTAAKQEIDTLNSLATFSQTAAQTVGAIYQKIEAGKKQAVNDTIYATGISSKELMELSKLERNFNDQTYFENDAIRNIVNRTGASIQQIRFLVQNSNAKYWNESTALAEQRGSETSNYIMSNYDTQVDIGNGMTASLASTEGQDLKTQKLVFDQLRRQYNQENPTELSTTILAAKTDPIVKALENSIFQTSNAEYRKNARNDAQVAIDASIREDIKAGYQVFLSNLANRKGAQRSAYLSDFYRVMQVGALSDNSDFYKEFWQNIITSDVEFNGKLISFAELQGGTSGFQAVNDAFYQGRAKAVRDFNLSEQENRVKFESFARDTLEQAKENGIDLTNADIEGIRQAGREQFKTDRFTSTILDEYERNNTVDALFVKKKSKELQDLADRGLLTEERLDMLGLPNSVTQPFRALARQTSADRKENNDFKPQMEAIKNLVRSPAQIRAKPDGTYSWTVPLMEQKLQNKFLTKYAQLKAGGDPNAVANAMSFVQQEFTQETSNPEAFSQSTDNLGGYREFETLKSTSSAGQSSARMNWVQSSIGRLGSKALDSNGSIFTISELNQQQEDMMKPGYKMDPMAAYVGKLFGIDPLAVINRQRLAAGMEALQLPESTMSFASTVNPALKRMLDAYQTPEISTRAMISTGTFNPTLVPKNYVSLVTQSAAKYGVPPNIVAAVIEKESSWNKDSVSPAGARGLMQLMPQWHTASFEPQANVDEGVRYLGAMYQRFGNWNSALAAYNMGPTDYDAYTAQGRQLPAETREYVKTVNTLMAKYGDVNRLQSPTTMRRSMSYIGRPDFERPSSVVYETSSGQPGVDLYFESKKFPAVLSGVVKDVSREPGYGNYVVVESTDPMTGQTVDVLYSHLADGLAIKPGNRIDAGDIIGTQGGTGNVRSVDGTIASIDFLAPAPRGSKSMEPYVGFDNLRRYVVTQLQR